jgi:predicted phage-related endonuclease
LLTVTAHLKRSIRRLIGKTEYLAMLLKKRKSCNFRTGGKANLDVQSAIKRQDDVDDEKAKEVLSRISEDEKNATGFVDSSIFNKPTQTGGN